MHPPPLTRRRWFRFSLRTMFVVVTVFAVWLGYHVNWIRERRQALSSSQVALDVLGLYPTSGEIEVHEPPWSLRLLGEQPLDAGNLVAGPKMSDAELLRIRALFPEIPVRRWTGGNVGP